MATAVGKRDRVAIVRGVFSAALGGEMPSLSHPTDGHHARRRLPLLGWIFCAFSATGFAEPVTVASVDSPGKVLRVSLQLDGGNPSYLSLIHI